MPYNFYVRTAKCQIAKCKNRLSFRPWDNEIEKTHCKKHALEIREKEADNLAKQIADKALNERINRALSF